MVAKLGVINLPFFKGADQQTDEHLLSSDMFARAENVQIDRNGRQIPRPGFLRSGFEQTVEAGTAANIDPIRTVGVDGYFVAQQVNTPYTQAYCGGTLSNALGTHSRATATLRSPAVAGMPQHIPVSVEPTGGHQGDREQTSSQVDTSSNAEWYVVVNCDQGNIRTVWYSKYDGRVLASHYLESGGSGAPASVLNYMQCSVVCCKAAGTRITVVLGITKGGLLWAHRFAQPGTLANSFTLRNDVFVNVNENCNFDAVARISAGGNGDRFAVIFPSTAAGGTIQLATFSYVGAMPQQSTIALAVHTQYSMCSVENDPVADEVNWAICRTDPGPVVHDVQMGRNTWATGGVFSQSAPMVLGANIMPGVPFNSVTTQIGRSVAFSTCKNVGTIDPTAFVYTWSGVNLAALVQIAQWPGAFIAGRLFEERAGTKTTTDYFSGAFVPVMQAGYSPLDTDTAYDDLRPVGLLSVNPSGLPSVSTVSNMGLLAINGEVGQATHPLVSPVLGGTTGWNLGTPSRNIQITENGASLPDDYPLAGARLFCFDVAIPGKSRPFAANYWCMAQSNLPREGRIAAIKPANAYESELTQGRDDELMVPGLTPSVIDGINASPMGWAEAPVIYSMVEALSGLNPLTPGTYSVTAVYEWTDKNGRRYQGPPSVPRAIVIAGANSNYNITFQRQVLAYDNLSIAIYRTPLGGSVFKRDNTVSFALGTAAPLIYAELTDSRLSQQETLYTSLGELPNDPPPSARRFTRIRDRVVASGIDQKNTVQFSKLLQDGRGIVWSNAANFFVTLPDEVTAVAELDETAVVFTKDAVFTVGGSGPDDTGIGTFVSPGRIPGYVGCASPRSVVSTDAGVFFLSQRGLELIPRGFGGAQWVGQPVRDTLQAYPYCSGATVDRANDRIYWSFYNFDQESFSYLFALVCLDIRTGSWSTVTLPRNQPDEPAYLGVPAGLTMLPAGSAKTFGDLNNGEELSPRLAVWDTVAKGVRIQTTVLRYDEYLATSGGFVQGGVTATWETGWMRFNGTNGWQIARRLGILYTALDSEYSLDARVFINDDGATYRRAVFTESSTGTSPGDTATVEFHLPDVQFLSIKVQVIVTSSDIFSGTAGIELHSMALYPESEGPRLPANRVQ